MSTNTAGLSVTGAAKAFGPRRLWSELTFTAPRGTMLSLTGPSGSGKTTLLNCLGLLEDFDDGELTLDGEPLTGLNARRRRLHRRDSLGYLFQNYALIDNATVRENLDVAVGKLTWNRRRVPAAYEEALERVGMSGRANEPVFRLSGGEQQRIAMARLLLKNPRLVLADEPTGALDADNATVVVGLLRLLADQGSVVVVATHNPDVADACDDRLVLGQVARHAA